MKKLVKRILLAVVAVLLLVVLFIGGMVIYTMNYKMPKQEAKIENTTGLVQAYKRQLYDADGNVLQLRGINAGQILLQEGWMSPFATDPLTNEDGSYVKDADGNIEYPEFTEEEFRAGIAANPNLNTYDYDELIKIYRDCFFTEEDFRIIKEDLQMNTIRLPIYYLDILNEDLTRKSEEDAFAYLDWFIGQAAAHELYIVLDLHGAPGSQSGYEHSGVAEREAKLWYSEDYINATIDLWVYITEHYKNVSPDLGAWIATYDILNEPTDVYKGSTTKICWDVFDRIYQAIRATGDQHVITMEGCWGYNNLPNPADYGWENVQYEYHWYNFIFENLPYELYFAYQGLSNIGRNYEVPTYIGEFTAFENRTAWPKEFALFDRGAIPGRFGTIKRPLPDGGLLLGACIQAS